MRYGLYNTAHLYTSTYQMRYELYNTAHEYTSTYQMENSGHQSFLQGAKQQSSPHPIDCSELQGSVLVVAQEFIA